MSMYISLPWLKILPLHKIRLYDRPSDSDVVFSFLKIIIMRMRSGPLAGVMPGRPTNSNNYYSDYSYYYDILLIILINYLFLIIIL